MNINKTKRSFGSGEGVCDIHSTDLFCSIRFSNFTMLCNTRSTGCPKKMVILSGFEFLTLGGVFLGVKNNYKNSGTKKNIRLCSKILSKMTLL